MDITTSPKNTTFGKISENNIDDKSYSNSIEEALKRVLSEPKTAYAASFDAIQPKEEYLNCLVDHIWKFRFGYGSFIIAKNSPYKMFFDNVIMKMTEDGRLQNLYKIWIDRQRYCPKKEEVPLGIEKTISIFSIIFFGIVGAMIFIIIEKTCKEYNEKSIQTEYEAKARLLYLMKDWINEEILTMNVNNRLEKIEEVSSP